MKKRLFAILMTLTLVFTYMPAIAFADGEGEPESASWSIYQEPSETAYIFEETGDEDTLDESIGTDVTLKVFTEVYSGDPNWTFEWTLPDGTTVDDDSDYVATEEGSYYCLVTDQYGNSDSAVFDVEYAEVLPAAAEFSGELTGYIGHESVDMGQEGCSVTVKYNNGTKKEFVYD